MTNGCRGSWSQESGTDAEAQAAHRGQAGDRSGRDLGPSTWHTSMHRGWLPVAPFREPWMQMSSGLQFAVTPSRCCHGVLPGQVGSCPPKAASPGGSTLIMREHIGVLSADQRPSPYGQGQNTQPKVFSGQK